MFVINPLPKAELKSFFDDQAIEVMKYFIIKSLFSQPERLPSQNPLPVQIPKEHIEQWFTQALNVMPMGAGSYPIDIYNSENQWGADIKMLSVKEDSNGEISNGISGEASLGQDFRGPGLALDGLFASKSYDEIKDLWLELYKNKFVKVRSKYPVDHFYYFFIIRSGSSLYLLGASINLDNLETVSVDYPRSSGGSSVFLNGMIDSRLGNTKIYKAKKRLELRLSARTWIDLGYALQFKTNFASPVNDLRTSISDQSFLIDRLNNFENLDIDII